MIINRSGGTRIVLLVGRFAIKFPIVQFGMRAFLLGMASNLQEAKMSNFTEGLPKTYYCNVFGLALIARRCRPVKHHGLFFVALEELIAKSELPREFWEWDGFPKNFGYLDGKLVKLDTGD